MTTTYRIIRFHFDSNHPDHHRVIATGLTLTEGQSRRRRACRRAGSAPGPWFDGYNEE